MSFADGTAEARVAARYADFDANAMHAEQVAHNRDRFAVAPVATTQVRRISVASDKAVNYLVSLSAQVYPNVSEDTIRAWADTVDRSLVSEKIDWLKAQVFKQSATPAPVQAPKHDVPAGRYAVTGNEGQTVFVRVDRPTEGMYAGRTFVKIQAGDDLHPVYFGTADALLAKITEAGPEAASIRYGREIGDCGRCGRTLTDEASRAAGIGPICAAKGW